VITAVATSNAQLEMRRSDVAAAEASIVRAQSDVTASERRLTRSETLSKEGASSIQELDDDRARVLSARASLDVSKAQAVAARSAVEAARTQVVGAEATVAAAAATVARIQADIRDTTLVAPRDGRVQYRVAEPGEVVAPGAPVLNLVDLGDVYMTFFLPETVAGRIALGSEVRIVLDAAPTYVIPATVSFVASVAQFTPKTVETTSERQKLMFRVKAQIDRDLLQKHLTQVKTGLPGVAWTKLNPQATWPQNLTLQVPGPPDPRQAP
jgi:HlyD family secretion protein